MDVVALDTLIKLVSDVIEWEECEEKIVPDIVDELMSDNVLDVAELGMTELLVLGTNSVDDFKLDIIDDTDNCWIDEDDSCCSRVVETGTSVYES